MEDGHKRLFIKIMTDTAMESVRKTTGSSIKRNVELIVNELSKTIGHMTLADPIPIFAFEKATGHYSLERRNQISEALNFEFFQTTINNELVLFRKNGNNIFPPLGFVEFGDRIQARRMQVASIVVESITLVLHFIGVNIRDVNVANMIAVFERLIIVIEEGTYTLEEDVNRIISIHPGNMDRISWQMIKYMLKLVSNTYESEFLFEILERFFPEMIFSRLPQIIGQITGFIGMLAGTTDGFQKLALVVNQMIPMADGKRFVKHVIALERIIRGPF